MHILNPNEYSSLKFDKIVHLILAPGVATACYCVDSKSKYCDADKELWNCSERLQNLQNLFPLAATTIQTMIR